MKRKIFFSFVLAFTLLAGVGYGYAASAGTAGDPLISLSFLKGEFLDNILFQSGSEINKTMDGAYNKASAGIAGGSGDTGSFRAVNMKSGGVISLGFGGSAIVQSGSATLTVKNGEIINITDGITAKSGAVALSSRYLAAEDSSALIKFNSASSVLLDGDASVVSGQGPNGIFTDIFVNDWFYADVMSAVEMGLINGMTESTFVPNGSITKAQAIKLAACIHQRYHDGKVTLQNGTPWYQPYVDYALKNGIIDSEPADINSSASRSYYIGTAFNALPEKEYNEINAVSDNAVPDVKKGDAFYDEIYTFYRAGIITGSDSKGTFNPGSEVKRSEVATLIARMLDPGVRKTVDLP